MGEEIDGRADPYALAATAYHLLTAAQLFPHSNPTVVISRHLNSRPPRLADTHPELAALDAALSVALAKDPKERFSRSGDFALALAEHFDGGGMDAWAPTAPAPATRHGQCRTTKPTRNPPAPYAPLPTGLAGAV
jgi:serine/threonine protein kinase